MEPIRWRVDNVIDAHTHYRGEEPIAHYLANLAMVNHAQGIILTCRGNAVEDGGGDAIYRFARDFKTGPLAGRFYVYGGLQHDPQRIAQGDGRDFPRQVDVLMSRGLDGIKMMEGSPYWKQWLPHPLDHEYFRPFWAAAEDQQVPITLHLANPMECWRVEENREIYRDAEPQEEYFRQAEAVLSAHPRLRITFAHFMFMGPQLERLGRLFGRYPEMRVDLAMGHEYMYYLSDDVVRAREFFIRWQDRILYGTDVSDRNSTHLARAKADQVRLFLETDRAFTSQTSIAMGKPPLVESNGRSELHGLNLPTEALTKILCGNVQALLGKTPKILAENRGQ